MIRPKAFNRTNYGASYLPMAQAFFSAAGITDNTQKAAINQLLTDIQSIINKIYVLYPFVGGNATAHSYNLLNVASFQITWFGSPIHSTFGVQGDGIGAYGNTFFNDDPNVPDIFSSGTTIYNTATTGYAGDADGSAAAGYSIGQNASSAGGTNICFLIASVYRSLNDTLFPARNDNTLVAPNEWNGLIVNNRTTASLAVTRRNSTVIATNTTNVGSGGTNLSYSMVSPGGYTQLWQRPTLLLGINNPSNAQWGAGTRTSPDSRYYGKQRLGIYARHAGLSASELAIWESAVLTFQTTLGRNV